MIRQPADTPDLAERVTEATGRLRHNGDCDYPNPIATVGNLGDEMVRCWTCGRFVVLAAAGATLSAPEARPLQVSNPVPSVAVATGWTCREHDRAVNWRGRGCRDCADERRERQREHERAARAAARERADVVRAGGGSR